MLRRQSIPTLSFDPPPCIATITLAFSSGGNLRVNPSECGSRLRIRTVANGTPGAARRQFFDHYLKGALAPVWMTESLAPNFARDGSDDHLRTARQFRPDRRIRSDSRRWRGFDVVSLRQPMSTVPFSKRAAVYSPPVACTPFADHSNFGTYIPTPAESVVLGSSLFLTCQA